MENGDLLNLVNVADDEATHGPRVERDLARYRAVLAAEIATLGLTRDEALLLARVTNGTWPLEARYAAQYGEMTAWGVEDSVGEPEVNEFERAGGDWRAFAAKLRALSPGQGVALRDALERFWLLPEDVADPLAAVGLVTA